MYDYPYLYMYRWIWKLEFWNKSWASAIFQLKAQKQHNRTSWWMRQRKSFKKLAFFLIPLNISPKETVELSLNLADTTSGFY